jgi:hypothetical protein
MSFSLGTNIAIAVCLASFIMGYCLGLAAGGKRYYELGAKRGAVFASYFLGSLARGVSREVALQNAAERAGITVTMPGDEDTQ